MSTATDVDPCRAATQRTFRQNTLIANHDTAAGPPVNPTALQQIAELQVAIAEGVTVLIGMLHGL